MTTIEIYFNDLSEKKQNELIDAGYDNTNYIPLGTIEIGDVNDFS